MNQIFTKPEIKLYCIFQNKTLLLYKISKIEGKLLLLLIKKILKHTLFGVDVNTIQFYIFKPNLLCRYCKNIIGTLNCKWYFGLIDMYQRRRPR